MPFAKACQELTELTGIEVSDATARRQTWRVGDASLQEQEEQARPTAGSHRQERASPARMQMSVDGSMVPVVGGE